MQLSLAPLSATLAVLRFGLCAFAWELMISMAAMALDESTSKSVVKKWG